MATSVDAGLMSQLRDVYMFSELSDKHLRRVAELGKIVEHSAGHEIVSQGRLALGFHLLIDGEADVIVNGEVRRTLRTGEYFGEIAVIDRQPRSASVVARTQVRAWALSGTVFNDLLEKETSVAHSVLLGLCARLRELEAVPAQS